MVVRPRGPDPATAASIIWGYLLGVLLFVGLMLYWGFGPVGAGSYLSEMKDDGLEGRLLFLLLMSLLGLSCLATAIHHHPVMSGLRGLLLLLVGVLMFTHNSTALHEDVFITSVVLAVISVLSVVQSLVHLRRQAVAIVLCAALALVVGWDGRWGSDWQKGLIVFCLCAEAVQIGYCLPRLPAGRHLGASVLAGLRAILDFYLGHGPSSTFRAPRRGVVPCPVAVRGDARACRRVRTSSRVGSWPTAPGHSRGGITGW